MTLKNCDHEIKFEVKLKTKIGKSKYSVLVACRVPNAVYKTSYLEIFCCNVDLHKSCRSSNSEQRGEEILKIASKFTEL
jgi:hypothetical protein